MILGRRMMATNSDNSGLEMSARQDRMLIAGKQSAEALRIGKLIEQKYPRNSMGEALGQYNRWLEKQINPKNEAAIRRVRPGQGRQRPGGDKHRVTPPGE